jgi:uncharacterized protein
VLMALGTFVFSLRELAPQTVERNATWRHASSERVGARPARQYLGPGEETIDLSGVVAPELTGRAASLETLEKMASEGRPLALVDGSGKVRGAFVIVSSRTTSTLLFQDGTPRRIEFALSLSRVDDVAKASGASA